MLEFYPWSEKVFDSVVHEYESGILSALDLELGGACDCQCIYCDSPNRNIRVSYPIESVESLLRSKKIKWLFVCGIGEPLFGDNWSLFERLLSLCDECGVKCTIFSNALNNIEKCYSYIRSGLLNILFKYDSLTDSVNEKVLGKKIGVSYNDIFEKMKSLVKLTDGATNIAASIVPTSLNENQIVDICKKCFESNIFPLVGTLELAGQATEQYESLALSNEQLLKIKNSIGDYLGVEYKIPVCPSAIGAIHVSVDGSICVDKMTGLSCSWFWLGEPQKVTLANLITNFDYNRVCQDIIEYRKGRVTILKDIDISKFNSPFGGCGGSVQELISFLLR